MAIITEQIGDIFSAPANSILIHACNARGAWGSGVAVSFKQKYPYAFRKYNAHCLSPPIGSKLSVKQHQASIVGTTLLIPPSKATKQRQAAKTPQYIACLFNSLDYGKRVSSAEEILKNTREALEDLARQVAELRVSEEEFGACYAVRINSGKFGIEWEKTKAVLEAGELDITVVSPAEEERADGAGAAAGKELGHLFATSGGLKARRLPKPARAKAGGPLDKQMVGVKRKMNAEMDGDKNSDCENAKGKQVASLHPGIAKRRKKLRIGQVTINVE